MYLNNYILLKTLSRLIYLGHEFNWVGKFQIKQKFDDKYFFLIKAQRQYFIDSE